MEFQPIILIVNFKKIHFINSSIGYNLTKQSIYLEPIARWLVQNVWKHTQIMFSLWVQKITFFLLINLW